MRRSMYQRTFLKGSSLYREDLQRRPSTLPPHIQHQTSASVASASYAAPLARVTLTVPVNSRLVGNLRYPRMSCSVPLHDVVAEPRRYHSVADDDRQMKASVKMPSDVFTVSQDSDESSESYTSPRSYHSFSNPVDDLESDVFSRKSSEISEEAVRKSLNKTLKYRSLDKRESTDTNDETWRTASPTDAIKTDNLESNKNSRSDHDVSLDNSFEYPVKKDSGKTLLQIRDDINKEVARAMPCRKAEEEFFRQALLVNRSYYEEHESESLARNKCETVFKFDLSVEEPDQSTRTRKSSFQQQRGKCIIEEAIEKDEGFTDLALQPRDGDEKCDMFGSNQQLHSSATFRKERSLDSDETSGFVSKYSSETTDLSIRLANTQIMATKQLSEPMGFGSVNVQSELIRQQQFSETVPQHLQVNSSHSDGLLAVDSDRSQSRRRENFRKSKRLKHFNLRRIDDTDNEVVCGETERSHSEEDQTDLAGSRLKKEVGLPKYVGRDISLDRYGFYKSRSEKTITSFESDRGQSRLQDFEAFCEAVNFHGPLSNQQRTVSADELETADLDALPSPSTPPAHGRRRRSRSSRNLTNRLKCLLL